VYSRDITDILCTSQGECQTVANFFKMVDMGEQKRWAASKITDLRDQDGDTITVPHPRSGDMVTVFLTDMAETFQMPATQRGKGTFSQKIEGWRR
jgi:hypothetical protein